MKIKKYHITLLLLFTCFRLALAAPVYGGDVTRKDSIETVQDKLTLPQNYDRELEQLVSTWHKGYSQKGAKESDNKRLRRYVPDSVYARQLAQLPSVIPMPYNSQVREAIDLFLNKRSRLISSVLTMGDLYYPIMDEIFDRNQVPIELKYLTIVESGLNPRAVSPAGAAGLWQFMLPTGKIYGLEINSLVDERLSIAQSTEAAAKYLKDMYKIYNDWPLVIAAYNCGPGRVNSAIRRAGGKRDFWAIYPYLPRETRRYVPLFIGAYFAMAYHKEYDIRPIEMVMPIATDTIMINKAVPFARIRALTEVSEKDIELLNPQYKRQIIPGQIKPYPLRLPLKAIVKLDASRETLFAPTPEEDAQIDEMTEDILQQPAEPTPNNTKYHKVRRGDTLSGIAKRYHTTVSAIKRMNNLKSNHVRVGRTLIVRK